MKKPAARPISKAPEITCQHIGASTGGGVCNGEVALSATAACIARLGDGLITACLHYHISWLPTMHRDDASRSRCPP